MIDCKTCKYKREYFSPNSRLPMRHVWCDADYTYIHEYFVAHKIKKIEGYIGIYNINKEEFPLKKTPKWCPLKERH